jgi:hypothetical protein
VRRVRIQYFFLLAQALVLFAIAAWLTPGAHDPWSPGLARFVVLALAIASAVGTWGTAVLIASVHKKSWALWLSTSVVVVAGVTFLASCYLLPA